MRRTPFLQKSLPLIMKKVITGASMLVLCLPAKPVSYTHLYRTSKYADLVRTFCMNPKGEVVNENTNGIVTVNGHSYEDPAKQTANCLLYTSRCV